MSVYLVGPVQFGSNAPKSISGALYIRRPEERTSPPCLTLGLHLYPSKDMDCLLLFGTTGLTVSAHRRIAPTSWSGEVIRLPRCEGSFGSHTMSPGASDSMEVDIPLDPATIHRLDDLRGQEYGLHLDVRVRLRFSNMSNQHSLPMGSGMDLSVSLDLTNDNWRELLKLWDWPRIRVFEIRASSFPTVKAFDEAARKLDEAQRSLERGDLQGSVTLSREVIDVVLNKIRTEDHSSERNEKHGARKGNVGRTEFLNAGVPVEFWNLYLAMTEIATAADQPEDYPWSPNEARLMLVFAAGLAEHLGTVFQRARASRP